MHRPTASRPGARLARAHTARMSGDTPSNQPFAGHGGVYWRRRVIALAAGIAVVGLIVWTVNGALGGGAASPSAQVSRVTGHGHPAGAGRASGTAAASAASPRATHPAAGASGPGHSRPPRTGPRGTHPSQRDTAGKTHPCAPASLVITLFAAQYSYPAHALPRFQADVVSTAPGICSFALTDGRVQLLIKAGGIRRVWDSADCARPAPAARAAVAPARLSRGVPAVLWFTWDRKTSVPGCRVPGRAAHPGTYTATATSGRLSSQSLIFVLRAPGIGVP
jgi:hypothetical protein